MTRTNSVSNKTPFQHKSTFPLYGWLGFVLVVIFWAVDWSLPGLRTLWAFFPMRVGYSRAVDGLVFCATPPSLLRARTSKYFCLFIIAAPVWYPFRPMNLR